MGRFLTLLLSLFALALATPAQAEVRLSFHSFNGSYFFGRYPHTFILMEGTLDRTGEKINENYGFSAEASSSAVLRGPVKQLILIEKPDYIAKTNRHFTVAISDAQYGRIKAEVAKWRDAPGPYYNLETRNCIHFVGTMAQIAGIKIAYPDTMLRRPKKWLNYISQLNPQLGAKQVD